MSIGRICNREVSLAEATETIAVVARRMAEHRVGSLVVRARDGRPIGILTDRDLVRRVLARGLDPSITRVGGIMTPRPRTASEGTPIEAALARMRTHRIRRLVVVDDEGALAGILALDDVLALLAEEMTKVGHLLAEGTSDRTPREIASPVWAKTETVQPIGRADLDRQFRAAMRRRLRERREAIFRVVADAEDDLRFIAEDRESEPEERAQEEVSAQLLARLDERGRRAIEEIDGALARLAEGAYGTCVACKHRIGYARLQAVPATTLCADCAREAEVERAGSETLSQHYPGHLAPDLALLSDREVERAVFDALREDGRVEMQELRIVWRHGILHADGALPSEGEHRIFRAIVLDVLGIEELDDHVCIDERLFEGRPSPGGARVLPPDVASTIGRPRPAGEEEGNEVLLPAGPVPDAE